MREIFQYYNNFVFSFDKLYFYVLYYYNLPSQLNNIRENNH